MSGFLCGPDGMHPYNCLGPGQCLHCDREVLDWHDPNKCALCISTAPKEKEQ